MVLISGLLYAHGDPIMGTVTAVNEDKLTITDKDNKTVVIMLEKNTKYRLDNKPAKKADLKAGARVVIDAHQDAKTKSYLAEEVQIGAPAAAPKAPAAPAKK
jgi:3'-phosphoadenosine 5'-phosphosulfate (PAPS) 3'-phosphatase